MTLNEEQVLKILMRSRERISAAAWVIVQDSQAAEDIFQNVAIKAMTRRVKFEYEGEVMSWAFISARREGIDWARRHKKEHLVPGADLLDLLEKEWVTEGQPEEGCFEALRQCLRSLPSRLADLLRLRYFEGYSCIDVAKRLEVGVDAVYKRLSRVHSSLRECVEARLGKVAGKQ